MRFFSLSSRIVLTSAILAAGSRAQEVLPVHGELITRKAAGPSVDRPVLHAVYDVPSDRVHSVHELASENLRGGAPCFDNSEIHFPDTYVVTDPGKEILSWGWKTCLPDSNLLEKATLLYLSTATSVADGGPGGTLSFALYSGTRGFGLVGTEVFRRTLSGLPSSSVVSPIVYLTIDFGTDAVPLADGPIGWGFEQLDGDTGPVLVRTPNPWLRTLDAIDLYSPAPASAASYAGTFHYPDCLCASTFFQLDEFAPDEVARSFVLNGTGANPEILEEVSPARIGHTWAARIDVALPAGSPASPFTVLFCSRAQIAPLAGHFGELLVDRRQLLAQGLLGEGSYAFPIPAQIDLIGTEVFVQGVALPPASSRITLTNALHVRFGY